MIPNGEIFYSVMDRLKKFCRIVSHGAVLNLFGLLIMQGPLDHFWTMYISGCGVSKVIMKEISKLLLIIGMLIIF